MLDVCINYLDSNVLRQDKTQKYQSKTGRIKGQQKVKEKSIQNRKMKKE